MPEDPLHQPHDKLFKAGFEDPANAAAFLSGQLPSALSDGIGWDRLRLEAGGFVDSHFRHSESDLLFSAPLRGKKCLVYLLFEHQRVLDRWIALRLLRYMVRIWERHLSQNPAEEKLPLIVPVVLAQNANRWELSPLFSALVEMPTEAESYLPEFTFRLIQLAETPFEKIQGTPAGIMILRVMKAETLEALLSDEVWDEDLLLQTPSHLLPLIFRYIADAGVDKGRFENKIEGVTEPSIRTAAMTIAQELRQEGRQEGHQKGLQEGQLQAQQLAVIETLEIRFKQVPVNLREEIKKIGDAGQLRGLLRAAICCADIGGFTKEF